MQLTCSFHCCQLTQQCLCFSFWSRIPSRTTHIFLLFPFNLLHSKLFLNLFLSFRFWPFKEYRTYILTYIQSGSVVCVLMTGFRSCFYGSKNLRLMLDFHTSLFQEHTVQTPSAAVTLTLSAGFLHYKGHHFPFGN